VGGELGESNAPDSGNKPTPILLVTAEGGQEAGILALSKATPKLFLAAGGGSQEVDAKATPILFLTGGNAGGEGNIIAVL
jgi:hypothetical protein